MQFSKELSVKHYNNFYEATIFSIKEITLNFFHSFFLATI